MATQSIHERIQIANAFPKTKSTASLEERLALLQGSLIRERDHKKARGSVGYSGSTSLEGVIERIQLILDGYDDQYDYFPGKKAS